MKKVILAWLVCIGLFACTKKNTTPPVNNAPVITATDTTIGSGNFVSNAHTTSGIVKVTNNTSGKNLVFENFKTDAGPDLRVYLSKATNANDFVELGALKATSGGFAYSIPAGTNIADYKFVLIWCQDFSVLFGNAQLQ